MNQKFDYIVIGSGFGGSVSAMRLAEKGYSVLVIEKGKRWKATDFPETNWNVSKYLWMPCLSVLVFKSSHFLKKFLSSQGLAWVEVLWCMPIHT